MNLRHLIDHVLLNDTKVLVGSERQIMSKVLHYLREIDRRKLFADLGFSSMFAYCTDELKYSPDQAQRRISACRMLTELPQIEKKLDDGSLNLTVLGMANTFFKEHDLKTTDKNQLLEQLVGKSKKEVEIILAHESPALANEAKRKVSKTQTKVTLILDDAVVEKLQQLQAFFSHSKKRNLPELIDFLCTQELARRQKSTGMPILPAQAAPRAEGQEAIRQQSPESVQVSKPKTTMGRSIPSSIKKEIWSKALGKCQHPLCTSKHFLQIHHVTSYSEGGTHQIQNLKLLCHAHHARGHRLSD